MLGNLLPEPIDQTTSETILSNLGKVVRTFYDRAHVSTSLESLSIRWDQKREPSHRIARPIPPVPQPRIAITSDSTRDLVRLA